MKSSRSTRYSEDYVERSEFRFLLKYLHQYYIYWIAFDEIDTGDDRRISHAEFIGAAPLLQSYGIDMSNAEQAWGEATKHHGTQLLFTGFCDWAIKKNLSMDEDDDEAT